MARRENLPAVRRDDALLDAVSTGQVPDQLSPTDERLARILAGWSSEIRSASYRELVDVTTATELIRPGRHRRHGKRRAPRPSRQWVRQQLAFLRRIITNKGRC